MTNIIKPDQHIASYIYQKQTDPDIKIVLRAYKKRIVEQIDRIVELAHGQRDFIENESDWVVVEELLKFFASEWPHEFNDFIDAIPSIREAKGSGYSKSNEIKHVGSIPPRFMKMLKAIFPAQQWDKTFINKFVKRFPLFKVGGRS